VFYGRHFANTHTLSTVTRRTFKLGDGLADELV
jgi:hypothetical protein